MMGFRSFIRRMTATISLVVFGSGAAATADAADPENLLYMDLESGRVVIQMRPELAPNHVAQIKRLTREGFYDGVLFHRVIDGFMAQTGDPLTKDPSMRPRWGTGGADRDLKAEFNSAPHVRGTVSMARSADPNSASSQFFIVFQPATHLDRNYTVWGRVISGMEHVDALERGAPGSGTVANPDRIVRMRVAADAQ